VLTDADQARTLTTNGFLFEGCSGTMGGLVSNQRAIDDYVTALELFVNKDRISSVSYLGIARSYRTGSIL